MSETLIDIPGRLHSVATDGIVTGANELELKLNKL